METPLCERIYKKGNWRVVHSYDTSLEGWLCLLHQHNITTIAEMSEADAVILGQLIHATSQAVQQVTGAAKTYVIQFAESPKHPEVHFHIVPRAAEMPEDKRGVKVFGYLGRPESEVVTLERRNQIAEQVRAFLIAKLG